MKVRLLSWKKPPHRIQSPQFSLDLTKRRHKEKTVKQEQGSTKEVHTELMLHSVKFAKNEQGRRKEQQVLFKWPDIQKKLGEHKHIYVVDGRLGSNNHTHRLWFDVIPPHTEEGQDWRTLGHRHTVEAIIYFLKGHGHSIIDGVRYDWGPGDLLSVPMFSWHRHINDGDDPVLRIASTTGPLSLALGQAVYEDERYPEFWIYAQEGEDARKTLIPGGGGQIDRVQVTGSRAADLYAQEVAFAMHEEQLRRKSKVLVKQSELVFEPTAMGSVAYVVDPRIGFQSKALGVVMAEIPPGKRSGAHRHFYDEIDLVVGGRGKIIVADKEYEFDTLDVLSIPVFQWHQYFNTGAEPLRIVAINTRLALENLGLSLTHQGELADY
jgi:gentisate 1,2-dioxygenase